MVGKKKEKKKICIRKNKSEKELKAFFISTLHELSDCNLKLGIFLNSI